jgi:hypothetical protein
LNDVDAEDDRTEAEALVVSLKSALPELEQLLDECNGQWGYEDRFEIALYDVACGARGGT